MAMKLFISSSKGFWRPHLILNYDTGELTRENFPLIFAVYVLHFCRVTAFVSCGEFLIHSPFRHLMIRVMADIQLHNCKSYFLLNFNETHLRDKALNKRKHLEE